MANLEIKVSRDAVDWLQDRACTIGQGGFDKASVHLYLAYKLAIVKGDPAITAEHLESVEQTTCGHEDFEKIEEVVAASSGRRIHRLG